MGATVYLLYVVDIGAEMAGASECALAPQLIQVLEDEVESFLDEAAAQTEEAGVTAERISREGDPHEVIVEYSAENGIGLVVMGASG